MFEFINTIKIILTLIVVSLLIFTFIKFKSLRWFLGTCFAIIFVLFSLFAGFSVNNYYSASGGIIGSLNNIIKGNQLTMNNFEFAIQNVVFKETDNVDEYNLTITRDFEDSVDLTNNYCIFINNTPCESVNYSSELIKGKFYYEFYDEKLELILSDILDINMVFYKTSVKLIITTFGGEKAVGLWNSYFNNNKFVISIKELNGTNDNCADYLDELDIVLKDFKVVEFFDNKESLLKYYVKAGKEMSNFPNYNVPTGYIFNGWEDEKGNLYLPTEKYIISENLQLVPNLTAETFVISFFKDIECTELLGTRVCENGYKLYLGDSEFKPSDMNGYRWSLVGNDNATLIPGSMSHYVITGNCSFYLYKAGQIN